MKRRLLQDDQGLYRIRNLQVGFDFVVQFIPAITKINLSLETK